MRLLGEVVGHSFELCKCIRVHIVCETLCRLLDVAKYFFANQVPHLDRSMIVRGIVRAFLILRLRAVWYECFICSIPVPWPRKLWLVDLIRRVCLVALGVHVAPRNGHTSN